MGIASSNPPLAVIAGPTASGKSSLAVALAERTGGVIVNADSAQVYRDLNIVSAAPSVEDLGRAEHRLYRILDGAQPCSAADWATLAKREIAEIHSAARLPILVGGTGLYLRTLLDGIALVPAIDPAVRGAVRTATTKDNHARLRELDPSAASRLGPNDSARIARALEVVLSTGRTLQDWQGQRLGGIVGEVSLLPLILLPPRDWLYERCDRRFLQMAEADGLAEVRTLLARRLDPQLPVMRAIGVRELTAYLQGASSFSETLVAGQQATRRYAKRQYTWFAHQPPSSWPRHDEPLEMPALEGAIAKLLSRSIP